MQNFDERDIPYYQIMDAFLKQYLVESQEAKKYLNVLDETERRAAISKRLPSSGVHFLESHTRQELETKSMILAIASSVAKACIEAHRILQQST